MHDIGDLRRGKSHLFQLLHMAEHLAGRSVQHHASMVHHDDAAHIVRHILHAVGDQHNGHSRLFPERGDLSQDLVSAPGIQSGGGLVQDQHVRLHGKDPRDGHSPLLPAGQIKGGLAVIFFSDPHKLQRAFCPSFHLFRGKPQIFRAEADIREYVDLKKLVFRILEHQAHLAPERLQAVALFIYIFSVIIQRSFRRLQKAVQMLYQRGFSGARVADEADEFSVLNGQADILQRGHAQLRVRPVYMAHMLQCDRHFASSSFSSCVVRIPSGRGNPFCFSSQASSVT